jgi:hypothetical protein
MSEKWSVTWMPVIGRNPIGGASITLGRQLPADRALMPGLITHSTNVVEHPDLVAERGKADIRKCSGNVR